MIVALTVLAIAGVAATVAALVAVGNDGYHRIPTRNF